MQDDLAELNGKLNQLEAEGVFVRLKARRHRPEATTAPTNPSGLGALSEV